MVIQTVFVVAFPVLLGKLVVFLSFALPTHATEHRHSKTTSLKRSEFVKHGGTSQMPTQNDQNAEFPEIEQLRALAVLHVLLELLGSVPLRRLEPRNVGFRFFGKFHWVPSALQVFFR